MDTTLSLQYGKRGSGRDLTGLRFGRLFVQSRGVPHKRNSRWVCVCDCGQTSIAYGHDLTSGHHLSCGCFQKERVTKHGATRQGGWRTTEYSSWLSMRQRCTNPHQFGYARYGGRGIRVCKRWDDFSKFLADMGPKPTRRHTLERVNNDKNYTPKNCVWATRYEQAQNRHQAIPAPRPRSLTTGRFLPDAR